MRLHLCVLNAPDGEQNFTIDPPGGLLGRSMESVACLPYESVSRQHAELTYDRQHWWLQQRSQNSLTLLDEQPLVVGAAPAQLLDRGALKLGRVVLQYWQEAAEVAPDPTAALASEVTMILPRRLAPMAIPPAMLAQMSPVRVAESAPPAESTTMIRKPATAASPELESPPTMIRRPAAAASPAQDFPPTMIRKPAAAASSTQDSPPTMIRKPAAASSSMQDSPPTMIRRSAVAVPPPPPLAALGVSSETPMTLIIRPGARPTAPATAAQPQPAPVPHTPPVAEHQPPQQAVAAPKTQPALPPDPELAQLRSERDRLTAEVLRLKRDNEELRDTRAALLTQVQAHAQAADAPAASAETPRANLTSLGEKALELLQPFGRSLEQAGEALRQGDTAQARGLLRTASFALADLRDLFQP